MATTDATPTAAGDEELGDETLAGGDGLLSLVEDSLADERPRDLRAAYDDLSHRYRSRTPQSGEAGRDVRAYLAARLPATLAATTRVLEELRDLRPDFAPRSLLDLGSGPGGAAWAATEVFASLEHCTLVESQREMARVADGFARRAEDRALAGATVTLGDATRPGGDADLVVAAYLLGEIAPPQRRATYDRWWQATRDCLVVIEPGTPAGYAVLLAARDAFLAAGARIIAPCPHELDCPLAKGDWCHFSARVARSSLHRLVKQADRGFEDEKYAYLVVARTPVEQRARVLRRPVERRGYVRLRLCELDGTANDLVSSRRDGARFVAARALRWGDRVDSLPRPDPPASSRSVPQ
jgi:ribosomal protein RSM22 (predicted rRNA methylase)